MADRATAATEPGHAHAKQDMSRAWGNGTTAAAVGIHMDTYLDNLLAEASVRYGAVGGIAYHYVSDLYIALFTHFVPCGVWEAVYIIEGLLKNASDARPDLRSSEGAAPAEPTLDQTDRTAPCRTERPIIEPVT
ncbi:hypothetical protein GCM10010507_19870 [Streptomyces cinnamoneus]|uniref:Tn3 transposase DDE domain-containing protein n=1 Tax=Streptomyces cinnamoneus TaxID=53446 RepID=A0A918TGY8_STRCJ|nr:Tn3 family transposase [Streptomyces cinnamoneus]GHC44803.1 hypothetical protein GCM10010507_19870 [Streptomyces cinnamoneus]